ncbi:MAG TPA: ATP-binding protein [Gaiellaceae bacterium]|nr:ATP-binding protein [Gaiellaceae bacterium]
MATAARAYTGFGLLLIAVHLAVGGSAGIYQAISLAAAGTVLLAVGVYRPPNAAGWLMISGALGLFAAGDIVTHATSWTTFPGPADVLYLTSYGLLLPGFVLLGGRTFPWRDWGGHVDAILITLSLGVAAWMVFLDDKVPLAASSETVVSFAYPVADTIAIGVMIRFALLPGRRTASYWLLVASLALLIGADASYVVPSLGGGYKLGSWLDAGWLGNYVLIGAAALHPSMCHVADEAGGPERVPVALRRMWLGGLAVLALPIAAIAEELTGRRPDVAVLFVAMAVLIAGLVARGVLLVNELERERRRAKDSELRLRMIFERAPVGISVGRGGIMSETNPALQRMLGYSANELKGRHYSELTYPEDRGLDVQAELDAGERDSFSVDKRYVSKDGRVVDTHVQMALDIEDGLGIAIIQDVTDRLELEAQLREAQKIEAVGKLAGGVAHDFNNLMTGVLGYSDLLLTTLEPDDPAREKIEAIREAAVRASELTQQLLAFGRRQILRTVDVDARDAVIRIEPLLRRTIGEDIRLVTIVDDEPVVVHADPTQLEQVVVNLAANAREAMPDGGTLTIGVRRDGDTAVLTVADTGVGMDEATQARVFDPFFTTKPFGSGSGLGLSTVHGIVGQSGGIVEVESEPGRGAHFRVRLPLAPVPRFAVA